MTFRIFIAFWLGLLSAFSLNVVGNLAYSELLLLSLSPVLPILLIKVLKNREARIYFLLAAAYLFSLIVSDLYRKTASADLLRGWSRVGITLVSIVIFFSLISEGKRVAMAYVLGSLGAGLVGMYQYGLGSDVGYLYKFYLGPVLSAGSFIAIGMCPAPARKIVRFMPLAAVALSFYLNARALAGITFMAYFTNILSERTQRAGAAAHPNQTVGISKWRVLLGLLAMALGAVAIFSFYRVAASKGWLGAVAMEKYEEQSQVNATGQFTIISGRTEILFSWPKIMESPLIGYGSWAKDWNYVYDRAEAVGLNPEAIAESYATNDPGVIPTHSHIFGAWLEAGIVGGLFWIFVFWHAARLLIHGDAAIWGRLSPLMVYIFVSFIWDLFFSPYGAERRMWDGFVIATIAWTEARVRQRKAAAHFRNALGFGVEDPMALRPS